MQTPEQKQLSQRISFIYQELETYQTAECEKWELEKQISHLQGRVEEMNTQLSKLWTNVDDAITVLKKGNNASKGNATSTD